MILEKLGAISSKAVPCVFYISSGKQQKITDLRHGVSKHFEMKNLLLYKTVSWN